MCLGKAQGLLPGVGVWGQALLPGGGLGACFSGKSFENCLANLCILAITTE